MKTLGIVTAAGAGLVALGAASRRIATHQAVLPRVRGHINTRVIRINQERAMPATSRAGALPEPQGDELP
jgi:hypothetical protein